MNLGYMKFDDDDADISTNAAVRLTPKMAYNVGFSHFMSLGNGKVHTRVDYSYDDDMEVTSNYSTSPALATLPASYKELRDQRESSMQRLLGRMINGKLHIGSKMQLISFLKDLLLLQALVAGGNFAVFMMTPKTQGLSVKYNF